MTRYEEELEREIGSLRSRARALNSEADRLWKQLAEHRALKKRIHEAGFKTLVEKFEDIRA